MRFVTESKEDVLILRFHGSLLGGPQNYEIHELVKRSAEAGTTNLLVDLGDVVHVNSSGIGGLAACLTTTKVAGGTMKLLNPAARIEELLRLVDLLKYFECYGDEGEALASFASMQQPQM